nr:beta-Ala-His dipeptidase [Lachnospiraceae bacterium]
LQGHMDMVAVSVDNRDMKTIPVKLMNDGEYLYADGTSLGGDDGIAVAYMMAIADDETLAHPALDLLITVNEEVGMDGAIGLDPSLIRGRRFVNLDSEDEGIFTTGCAGGVRVVTKFAADRKEASGREAVISIRGGLGGHSGQMINKGRMNANVSLARVIYELSADMDIRLVSLDGGTAANAIPGEAKAVVSITDTFAGAAENKIKDLEKILRHEFHGKDDGIRLDITYTGNEATDALSAEDSRKLLSFIIAEPDGVQAMSGVVEGLVETSLNLGVVRTEEKEVVLQYELRSMIESCVNKLKDKVVVIAEAFGVAAEVSASYPEWEYREDSPLRDKMVKLYREMYGKDPVIEVIHAGLECGVLAKKLEGFDGVSIGPDMQDIHTTNEKLSIGSVKRIWEYLVTLLETKD